MDAIIMPSNTLEKSMPELMDTPTPYRTDLPSVNTIDAITNSSLSSSNVQLKRAAIYIQDDCLKHRFIRSRDTSGIFERPERLHALKLGLAAAIARIEDAELVMNVQKPERASTTLSTDEGDLEAALARMAITPNAGPGLPGLRSGGSTSPLRTDSVTIKRTSASVSLLDHTAVKYIHGDVERDVYLENLISWARESRMNITAKGTEIPEGIPPLDLYLCPGSIDAIQAAVGAVCEAVDASVAATRGPRTAAKEPNDPCERAFVAIRPPGHHCGEDTPSGFCFINNVAVGAAHAHLKHGMKRIVILDIDLHHGNGTQSIVWQINEETYQNTLDLASDITPAKPGPQIFYGSLHDILSFPCEDGKPALVQAASTSIHGPHGQFIENIHLQKYDSDTHFWGTLYPQYLTLLHRAREFLDKTGGPGDDVMVFISCGFDAGEHEYPSMSRHHRKVPVGFYHRFTRETCRLADAYAHGRVVSVLEGGYSDRALTSGAMAHLCGLADVPGPQTISRDSTSWVDHTWWSVSNLIKLEKAVKPRKTAARANMEAWLARTVELLEVLDGDGAVSSIKPSASRSASVAEDDASTWASPTSRSLRERKKPAFDGALPESVRVGKHVGRSASSAATKPPVERTTKPRSVSTRVSKPKSGGRDEAEAQEENRSGTEKKLPRVILRVRPPDEAGPS